jgi:hypothetical protein
MITAPSKVAVLLLLATTVLCTLDEESALVDIGKKHTTAITLSMIAGLSTGIGTLHDIT